ncbi:MAG: hypothetical protein OXU66_11425 [Gammaproteobacteria bacterium]|nr:hypothetical protein [Gammaproteobacteria bacterium]MDD9959540.1 hypothetical protein [Gammaproteobacteria bacterium]
MKNRISSAVLIALFFSLSFSLNGAEFERVGTYDFPSTLAPEAQEHFLLGVGYLHSFGSTQAQREFRLVQELDPDFVLGYWGEAFTYQHPFFGPKHDGPGETLMRLGATAEERHAKARNDKELGFLKAAEAYALTVGDMPERRVAWKNAMAELYEKYPEDDEVKAFYAVSILSAAGASGDMAPRMRMQAGALAMELFKKNDNHPGAAHYVIHAFDDPEHAPIALEAAFKYADIAPAVSHARHMPTHIFIQHGKWNEVALWNESAYQVARELWQPGDAVGEQNHATDWGQYGDLQMGDVARSERWIARAEETLSENPGDTRSISTLKTVKARHIIETEQWELQEINDDLSGDQLLALGLSAINLGDAELAQQVADRMAVLLEESPNNSALKVAHLEVAGLSQLLGSHDSSGPVAMQMQEAGIAMLDEAVALANAGPLPRGAATPLKPAHEVAGDAYLHAGNAEKAAALFEQSLLRTPNRPHSLIGAARAYDQMNEVSKAADMYIALLGIWNDDSHPAVQEAKKYLSYN